MCVLLPKHKWGREVEPPLDLEGRSLGFAAQVCTSPDLAKLLPGVGVSSLPSGASL